MSLTDLHADVIDSRDIIARFEELQSITNEPDYEHDDDEIAELEMLTDFIEDEASYAEDWIHGAALIAVDYFEEYAQDLAEECGYINRDATWPYTCIDWQRAAEDLSQDYTVVTFDGEDYYVR